MAANERKNKFVELITFEQLTNKLVKWTWYHNLDLLARSLPLSNLSAYQICSNLDDGKNVMLIANQEVKNLNFYGKTFIIP